jgi:uncharacterized membrane protein
MDNNFNQWGNNNQNQNQYQNQYQNQNQNQGQYNYQGPMPEAIFINGTLNRSALKEDSRAAFGLKYGTALGATVIPGLITGGLALIPIVGGLISFFVSPVFEVGGVRVNNRVAAKDPGASLDGPNGLFSIFNRFWETFASIFVTQLFIFLWSLLLIVPGILKAYSWFLVPYILADNPNMSGEDARDLSAQMMYGHRLELFVLQLSFLGWAILGLLTLGLLDVFYIGPWLSVTISDYYLNLKQLENIDPRNYGSMGGNNYYGGNGPDWNSNNNGGYGPDMNGNNYGGYNSNANGNNYGGNGSNPNGNNYGGNTSDWNGNNNGSNGSGWN